MNRLALELLALVGLLLSLLVQGIFWLVALFALIFVLDAIMPGSWL